MVSIEQFESWSLAIGITVLVGWMLLVIWKIGQESKAGRYGYFVLFLALGAGLIGFVTKTILIEFLKI